MGQKVQEILRPRPPTKRAFKYDPITKKMHCYKSPNGGCLVTKLWESDEVTSFHDSELARATKEINDILKNCEDFMTHFDKLHENIKDTARKLSFIEVENRLFLVWTQCGEAIGPNDDPDTIKKALRLKTKDDEL